MSNEKIMIEKARMRSKILEKQREKANLDKKEMLKEKVDEKPATHPHTIIKEAIGRKYPNMEEAKKHNLARHILEIPNDKKVKVGSDEFTAGDFKYSLARSMDSMDRGVSRENEYHTKVIGDAQKIIIDMTTNGVTVDELKARNNYLKFTYQREAECMTYLSIYASSQHPDAKARYNELYKRLQKIREMRSAVTNATKSVADKVEKEQKKLDMQGKNEKAVVYPNEFEKAASKAMVGALAVYVVAERTGRALSDADKIKGGFFVGTLAHLKESRSLPKCMSWVRVSLEEIVSIDEQSLAKEQSLNSVSSHIAALRGRRPMPKQEVQAHHDHSKFVGSRFAELANRYHGGLSL